jgi:hypothetical protein
MLTEQGSKQEILEFIIGELMPVPEVYNPGGLTLMVDDFCVKSENLWQTVGGPLIEAIDSISKAKRCFTDLCGMWCS